MNDTLRMLVNQLVGYLVTAGILFGILDWSAEQTAIVSSIINSAMSLVMYFWKSGQGSPNTVKQILTGKAK